MAKVTSKKASQSRSLRDWLVGRLVEPTTWTGLLTIGTALATGGTAGWLNAATLPVLSAGIGLVLCREKGD